MRRLITPLKNLRRAKKIKVLLNRRRRKLVKGQKRKAVEMIKFLIAAEETKAQRSVAGVGKRFTPEEVVTKATLYCLRL